MRQPVPSSSYLLLLAHTITPPRNVLAVPMITTILVKKLTDVCRLMEVFSPDTKVCCVHELWQ
jgi:hypothetical protein